MKLRILGNSLRLRLSQSEVNRVAAGLPVEEAISFSGGVGLRYLLEPSLQVAVIDAKFASDQIRVLIPAARARDWALSDEVALKENQCVGRGLTLDLLIEKDFQCLKPRQNQREDESDLFVNPNLDQGGCQ